MCEAGHHTCNSPGEGASPTLLRGGWSRCCNCAAGTTTRGGRSTLGPQADPANCIPWSKLTSPRLLSTCCENSHFGPLAGTVIRVCSCLSSVLAGVHCVPWWCTNSPSLGCSMSVLRSYEIRWGHTTLLLPETSISTT